MLIVDDNTANRTVLDKQLSAWGMAVKSAESADEALKALESAVRDGSPFDLVLLDEAMRDMSGREIGIRMRANPAFRRTKIILATNVGDQLDAEREFDSRITKPVQPSVLMERIIETCCAPTTTERREHKPTEGVVKTDPGSSKASSMNILLVEDNAVNQMLATAILKKAGHKVDVAADGVEAVEAAANHSFDAVLMDIQMPRMDGLEAARNIRKLEDSERANVYIIAMTANALMGDRDTCLSAGMNDYLPKPIDQKKLLAALGKASSVAVPNENASSKSELPAEVSLKLDLSMINELEQTIGSEPLATMLTMTLAEMPATMALITAANAEGDLDKIRREVHDMGSNFGSYGGTQLSLHARAIERACRENNAGDVSGLLGALPDIMDETLALLRERVPALKLP